MSVAIVVHGGAGARPVDESESEREDARRGCVAAARAGHAVLTAGGSAIDAVIAAVVVLENDPLFNAGTGACLNAEGEVELDASVMQGHDGRAGAVGAVRGVRNPIQLARAVMERTPHILMVGDGATQLARAAGVELCDPAALITPRAEARHRARLQGPPGTVGAVARDAHGRLAAATSTGGLAGKLRGRIGDSPIIGAGTYADLFGAASSTGHGESIIRAGLARAACNFLRDGMAAREAARQSVDLLPAAGGTGGLILLDASGRPGLAWNTDRMSYAFVTAEGHEDSGA